MYSKNLYMPAEGMYSFILEILLDRNLLKIRSHTRKCNVREEKTRNEGRNEQEMAKFFFLLIL